MYIKAPTPRYFNPGKQVKLHGGAVVRTLQRGIKACKGDPHVSHCLHVLVDAPDTLPAHAWSRIAQYGLPGYATTR